MTKADTICITIPATLRPELLIKTLGSFTQLIFGPIKYPRYFAVVNVDPVGPSHVMPGDVEDVVNHYVDRRIIYHPNGANFARAFHRVWKDAVWAKFPFVFHLEEDWELLREIDLISMIETLNAEPDLAALRLSAFPAGPATPDGEVAPMKNWNRWVPWNGRYYEIKAEERHRIGVCGHPTLFKMEFIKQVFPHLDPERNPEKQFQGDNPEITKIMRQWRFGVWAKPGDPPAIRDLGRDWMAANGFQKKGSKAFFTEWEKAES